MEIAWQDRGKIPHDAYYQPYGHERGFEFDRLDPEMRHWWARVYDRCIHAEKKTVPGGTEILVVKE